MVRILFVCTGNTCRSPLAEGMLRHMLQGEKLEAEVRSAGVSAANGSSISRNSEAVLQEKGIGDKLTSSALNEPDVEWADVILTMTMAHKGIVIQRHPQALEKTFTLKEFVEDDPAILEAIDTRTTLTAELQLKQALSQPISNDERSQLSKLNKHISSFDISDPFGGSLDAYRLTAQEIELHLKKLVIKLQGFSSDLRDR
ncbi:low molecular weight protein arginine phosphatase [Paenibacillus sp. GP183]|uniref:low molecular weight protein arginine phosphatase n=1 Tax=Paenibacillus sp. GP183 TaxID=1882751 RepID=UPI000896D294|nr:low molecular weight protein arginine phosphatase [Paenibacillus sp. GP183]SEC32377.1 protein-tyrosine phosphatase [Paenibacillus sp. GP183]